MSDHSIHHEKLLNDINDRLELLTSFPQVFLRGIVTGVGTAIGATIVAAIAFSFLASVIDSVEDVPILQDIVERLQLQETIQEASDA